jgi:Mg2+/Co2+ transporter CorB
MQELSILITFALSAFFSGAETVFLSFNKARLPAWLSENVKGAACVERFIQQPERFLVTTLTGNNIVNVAYSSLTALYLAKHGFSEETTVLIATVALLLMGEALPKSLARQLADRLALRTGLALHWRG